MVKVRYATIVLLIIATPVFSASLVSYGLQLGGNNHADSIKAGTRVAYTQGNPADSQVFYRSDPLNWAATLAASGNQDQPGHPSNGLPIQGVANFVFNLELHQGTVSGPIVSNVSYYSTIHSGTGAKVCTDCAGGYTIPGPTAFCAGSAFTYVFDIGGVGYGPGTVREAISVGNYTGPYMEVGMYPTVDVGNTRGEGQLLGVGAGYGQWVRRSGYYSTRTTKGVGIASDLGVLPLVEGQIDVSQIPVGTYVLKLTPGLGHNVLRGDVDLVTGPTGGQSEVQAFAVPANQTTGDSITFILQDLVPCNDLAITSSNSVKTHGSAGVFGINGSLSNGQSLEPRNFRLTKVVTVFNQSIVRLNNDNTDVSVTSGTFTSTSAIVISTTTNPNDTVTVSFTNNSVPNNSVFRISFPGIAAACDNTKTGTALNKCWKVHQANVNKQAGIDVPGDVGYISSRIGASVTSANCTADYNLDGKIDVPGDLSAVSTRLGQTWSGGTCP